MMSRVDDVTWKIELSLLSATMLQLSEAAIFKMELFVKNSEWLLAVDYFQKELCLRWDIVSRSAFGFNEVIWKIQLLLKPAGPI